MKKVFFLVFMIVDIVFIFNNTSLGANFDGSWSGETSQNKEILFTIKDSQVTSIMISYSLSIQITKSINTICRGVPVDIPVDGTKVNATTITSNLSGGTINRTESECWKETTVTTEGGCTVTISASCPSSIEFTSGVLPPLSGGNIGTDNAFSIFITEGSEANDSEIIITGDMFSNTFASGEIEISNDEYGSSNIMWTATINPILCDDWAELRIDEYLISNNVWGKGDITNYKQCIFGKKLNKLIGGWMWKWPDTGGGEVKAYPEIIYGWKPWNDASTTPDLPIQLGDANNVIASYTVAQRAAGGYNTAFDLWITSQSIPTEDNITREIMIWLNREDLLPEDEDFDDVERVTIDGEEYDLFKADREWTYFAFVKVVPRLQGNTKLHEFIGYLIDNSYVSSDEFLASIEFGNEIMHGRGISMLLDYSVQVE